MEILEDETNLLADLQHDKELQQMARFRPLSLEQADHVDKWVSYYACEYTDAIGTTDARVYEILDAIINEEDFEIEGEEEEDPYPTKRDFELSFEHEYDGRQT